MMMAYIRNVTDANSTGQVDSSHLNQRYTVKNRNPERLINITDSSIFNSNNVYLLVFVIIAMLVTAIITFIRHRQQKLHAERKELEYLRYFHSILPHSQIYGDLNEFLGKFDRKKRRSSRRREKSKICEESYDSESKLCALSGLYKRFKYRHLNTKPATPDSDDDNEEDCQSIEDNNVYRTVLFPTDAGLTDETTDYNVVSAPDGNAQKYAQLTNSVCKNINVPTTDHTAELNSVQMNNIKVKTTAQYSTKRETITETTTHHRVHFNIENTTNKPLNSRNTLRNNDEEIKMDQSNVCKNFKDATTENGDSIQNMQVTEL